MGKASMIEFIKANTPAYQGVADDLEGLDDLSENELVEIIRELGGFKAMGVMTYEDFLSVNANWLKEDNEISKYAYANYKNTATRYKENRSCLIDLYRELDYARQNNIHVGYVMTINAKHNFSYSGHDLDLDTLKFVDSTKSISINTTSGNDFSIPDTMYFERREGINPFENTVEYIISKGQFNIGLLFYY